MAQLVGSNSLGLGKLIDGKNQFVHIMYSANVDGSNMTSDIQADTKYIGIVTSNSETAPANPSDYSWGRFVGTSGTSSYTWLRYSPNEDGSNMTVNPTPETKYIGVAITADNNAPTDYTKYSWALIKGDDGRGISKTEVTYQKSTSGTVIPTGTWVTTIPTVNAGEYLWTRTLFTYTDNTTSSTYSVARSGVTGLGISRSDVDYQKSTSGTVAPTGAWTATIPTVAANEYLWTRTTLTYTNATTSVSYSVGKMGADGKDAQLLYLTASSQIQAFDKDDRPKTTQAITISAKLQNTSGVATFVAIPYIGNIAQTPITLGGTGNDRTLLPSQWTNTQWTTIAITATLGSLTDTISVIRVKDGDTGATGKDGVAGKDGVGLKSTAIQYAQSTSGTTAPTTGWATNVPTLAKGQYLWTKTVWTYTDDSSETGYTVSYNAKDGNTGKDGIAGKDGVGISGTIIEYVRSTSGTTKPTTGWSTTIPSVPEGQYLWTRTTWQYSDGTMEQGYSAALMGPKGDKGVAGDNGQTPVVHQAWSWSPDGMDRFTTIYPGENLLALGYTFDTKYRVSKIDRYFMDIKTGIPIEASAVYVFQWEYEHISGNDSEAVTIGYANENGYFMQDGATVQITDKKAVFKTLGTIPNDRKYLGLRLNRYQTSTSSVYDYTYMKIEKVAGISDAPTIYTPAPSEDYTNAYPLYEGTYTDYSETASQNPADYTWRRILGESGEDGVAGSDGKGIKSTAVTYQASTSGTVAPTGTWVANPPTVAKGQYLWTRTIWTYTDNTTETGYAVAYMGTNGNNGTNGVAGKDGVGIKTTAITYTVSSSGTTAPTSGWAANPPTATAGQFMWTKTVWTYTDNTTETGYSVGKIGNTGPKGDTGATGATGNGISTTKTEYQASTSGTTPPTGTWTTTIPSVAENQYLWTRVVLTFTDTTTATFHSVGKMGAKGSNGTNSYFHTAWADSSDGKTGFSTTVSLGKKYLGSYADNTAAASTNPTKYKWVELANAIDIHTAYKMADGTFSIEYPQENLILNSNFLNGLGGWASNASGVTIEVSDDAPPNVTNKSLKINTTGHGWQQGPKYSIPGGVKAKEAYTISFWAKSDADGIPIVCESADDLRTFATLSTTYKFFTGQVSFNTLNRPLYIYRNGSPNNVVNCSIYINSIMLSKGINAVPTGLWVPAPSEDWANAIPKYVGTCTKDSNNPDDYTWTLNPEWVQMSSDKGLEDKLGNDQYLDDKGEIWTEIGNKVSQEEANEIRDMASSVENSLTSFLNDGGKYEADLASLEARSSALVQQLGDQLATYEFIKTYISLGEEGLVIGAHDSTLKMLLSNGQLSFVDGGQTVAYFASQKFYINSGAVVESLQIGYHKIASLDKDNTVWQWIQG